MSFLVPFQRSNTSCKSTHSTESTFLESVPKYVGVYPGTVRRASHTRYQYPTIVRSSPTAGVYPNTVGVYPGPVTRASHTPHVGTITACTYLFCLDSMHAQSTVDLPLARSGDLTDFAMHPGRKNFTPATNYTAPTHYSLSLSLSLSRSLPPSSNFCDNFKPAHPVTPANAFRLLQTAGVVRWPCILLLICHTCHMG